MHVLYSKGYLVEDLSFLLGREGGTATGKVVEEGALCGKLKDEDVAVDEGLLIFGITERDPFLVAERADQIGVVQLLEQGIFVAQVRLLARGRCGHCLQDDAMGGVASVGVDTGGASPSDEGEL